MVVVAVIRYPPHRAGFQHKKGRITPPFFVTYDPQPVNSAALMPCKPFLRSGVSRKNESQWRYKPHWQ
jgi:hypothetical protein